MGISWPTALLLLIPIGIFYPVIHTAIVTAGTPGGVRFYFSILYGPDSVSPISANFYVFIMITIPFLYVIQIMKTQERGILVTITGFLCSFFILLLTATGMYYPILHRVYAPISILMSMLYLATGAVGLFHGAVLAFMFLPIASGILTMITWQWVPNDLLFSIGQLLLFLTLNYGMQISQLIFELNLFDSHNRLKLPTFTQYSTHHFKLKRKP
jgi:hypothetical protein